MAIKIKELKYQRKMAAQRAAILQFLWC